MYSQPSHIISISTLARCIGTEMDIILLYMLVTYRLHPLRAKSRATRSIALRRIACQHREIITRLGPLHPYPEASAC